MVNGKNNRGLILLMIVLNNGYLKCCKYFVKVGLDLCMCY